MSVARICDGGHRVAFCSHGGDIVDNETGSVTKFDRVDDVYRLEVNMPESNACELGKVRVEAFSGRGE